MVKIDLIASDDRIAELIEVAINANCPTDIPLDKCDGMLPALVVPLQSTSKDYLEWVHEQCVEMDQTDAHYNEDPFANKKPTAHEKIMGMADFEKPKA